MTGAVTVPGHKVLCDLGQGAFGTVHKLQRKRDGRLSVLKLVNLTRLGTEKDFEQALEEAQILKELRCAFIVKYYDAYVVDGRLHIFLEYCEEGDLRALLVANPQPLPELTIWRLFLCVTLGLQYLHKRRILHRDVKSANIFLKANGGVRIGDLGVAKQLYDSMSAATTLCGSPAYLSPEQAKGTDHYTAKCDMWALGVILYELSSAKHKMPFFGHNLPHTLQLIQTESPEALPVETPTIVTETCGHLLEKDPDMRPHAHEVLQRPTLKDIAATLGLLVETESFESDEEEGGTDSFLSMVRARIGCTTYSFALRPTLRKMPYCEVCAAYCDVSTYCSFTPLRRRHHCRMCGRSVCLEHAVGHRALPRLGYDKPQLLCETCFLLPDDGPLSKRSKGLLSGKRWNKTQQRRNRHRIKDRLKQTVVPSFLSVVKRSQCVLPRPHRWKKPSSKKSVPLASRKANAGVISSALVVSDASTFVDDTSNSHTSSTDDSGMLQDSAADSWCTQFIAGAGCASRDALPSECSSLAQQVQDQQGLKSTRET